MQSTQADAYNREEIGISEMELRSEQIKYYKDEKDGKDGKDI